MTAVPSPVIGRIGVEVSIWAPRVRLIYEADDLDAAIELAAAIPAARLGGAIEVRPTMEW